MRWVQIIMALQGELGRSPTHSVWYAHGEWGVRITAYATWYAVMVQRWTRSSWGEEDFVAESFLEDVVRFMVRRGHHFALDQAVEAEEQWRSALAAAHVHQREYDYGWN